MVTHLLQEALDAIDYRRGHDLDDVAVGLAGRCSDPRLQRTVIGVLLESMTIAVTAAWRRGWQPADVHRLAGRRLAVADQALVVDAMSHELNRYAASTIDPHWLAQLSELEGGVWWPSSVTWIDARRTQGTDWLTLVLGCLAAWHLLVRLPTLEQLTPLPGDAVGPPEAASARTGDPGGRPPVDQRVLSRVRMLLAKAESTTFEAEAETFTAGAQSLMARHSIDAALLAADDAARHRGTTAPHGRRISVDNPYDAPKAMLLDAVASANRCRMVWSRELGFGTVVGFEADLECVELLFTSLLVQATHTLTSAGSRSDGYGRSRTRSFRSSFLTAYASRIGERLAEATAGEEAAATAEASTRGRELVPLLAARAEQVDEAVDEWFPKVTSHKVGSVRDAEGWHSGRAAADRAQLGAGPTIGR
ncbi:hypothetical protein BA895_02275 [Humibacillus sp. DSM 29435]|uniref:DUF2786 domain-containing protein n=1 Tax=Humibacillus sp. DSM 29435 TaxID=1869167 RepID=UPI000872047D|nr:DUF2786 domain-containing protein [Humibacillus sp. DSM 29435]OFE18999.1 hypothetical protein BA895_02275 [Humibacillus sp. DSM 29435]